MDSYRNLTDEQLIDRLRGEGDADGKIMDYILDKIRKSAGISLALFVVPE